MLLYAAGEFVNGLNIDKIPEILQHKEVKYRLKHMCREAIRKHLIDLNPHLHLFTRIPQLELPSPVTRYLLFYMSLD